jgi:hypothetical protein
VKTKNQIDRMVQEVDGVRAVEDQMQVATPEPASVR